MEKPINKGKVLVTGGAGFIGGHLVDELIKRGYEVVVLDSLASPTQTGELPKWFNPKAQFIEGNVKNKEDWRKALRDVSFVYHLAGYMDFRLDFSTYYSSNVVSTALLYELIVEDKLPIKKVIASSSQAVYGEGKYTCPTCNEISYPEPRTLAMLETGTWDFTCQHDGALLQSLLGSEKDYIVPHNPYSISKRCMEETMLYLGSYAGVLSYGLRYTIVHGPRQSLRNFYSGALRQFILMAMQGKPFTMHEDGMQRRDFIHVNDLVSAHIAVLENEAIPSGVYNVGSGRTTLVSELAKAVAEVVGVPYNPHLPGQYRIGTARHSVEDISKLQAYGWKPVHTIEDNVRDYYEWIKNSEDFSMLMEKDFKDMEKQKITREVKNEK